MRIIVFFSGLLLAGILAGQFIGWIAPGTIAGISSVAGILSMVGLAFIMIHVGYEFELDAESPLGYVRDVSVSALSAVFPWLLAALYLAIFVSTSEEAGARAAWIDGLLAGRFAAPTATGVLFPMLAAAGLSVSWVFRKTRILAVLTDLSTVVLMLPIKVLMVGLAWPLGGVLLMITLQLWLGRAWYRRVPLPIRWPWILAYSAGIVAVSEAVYLGTRAIDFRVAVQIEVLLPALVLGCTLKRPPGADPHRDDYREGHQEGPESRLEQRVSTVVTSLFMVLVGLSMPLGLVVPGLLAGVSSSPVTGENNFPASDWGTLAMHVLVLTVLINFAKLVPASFYRKEASLRERLAVALAMCPRGAVGAGFILLSIEYGIDDEMVSVAVTALVLNLLSTPFFIWAVKILTPRIRPAVP